jgi:hypothetical protein
VFSSARMSGEGIQKSSKEGEIEELPYPKSSRDVGISPRHTRDLGIGGNEVSSS